MRISSLARKIKLKPSELIAFFENHDIVLDSGAHTKLSEDQVEMVYEEFAPEFQSPEKEEITEPEVETTEVPEISEAVDNEPEIESIEASPQEEGKPEEEPEPEEPSEEIEVIRAPKITLPGLKVKGKIDLPEPKKPEPKEETESEKELTNKRRDRQRRDRKRENDYNPVAAARKRKEQKEEKERLAELKKKKKAKTQHYYKIQQKVAKSKREKSDNIIEVSDSKKVEVNATKKNVFQKFWKWFNS
ncbi:MAG: hypothetical protein ACFHWX_17025 [Bacteroidota bacterium]